MDLRLLAENHGGRRLQTDRRAEHKHSHGDRGRDHRQRRQFDSNEPVVSADASDPRTAVTRPAAADAAPSATA